MIGPAPATTAPSMSSSEDVDYRTAMSPYNPLVSWPPEYTQSLEKQEVKDAFRKTYNRICQAGCQFLLLEPAGRPGSLILFLPDF